MSGPNRNRRIVAGVHPVRELLRADKPVFRVLVDATRERSDEVDDLLALAKERELGDQMKEALLSAHFEQGINTGSVEALQQIADTVGLDPAESAQVLAGDKYTDEVRADGVQARELGVTGVPFFVLENKYGISGAQPSEVFEQALGQVWQEIGGDSLQMLGTPSTDGETCGPEGCN